MYFMYGIFLDVSDWEFNVCDILIKNNGKYCIFKTDLEAKDYILANGLESSDDGYGHGRTYHIDKIEVL